MRSAAARLSVLLAAAILSAGRAAAGDEDPASAALGSLARANGQSGRLLRVGLAAGHRILVSSDRPFRIVDPATGRAAWREAYSGEVVALADGGPSGETPTTYRVQTGAFATSEAAEAERERLEREFGEPAVVRYSPDRGSWRVRVGKADSREVLGPLAGRLRAAGIASAWISEEPAAERSGIPIRLVDPEFDSQVTERTRLAVVPSAGGFVEVEGKPFRGIIEIRVTPYGTLRAIDWVDLESYLRGVVPAELGPEVWPQIEALKAQAVAARTYALGHLGQFEEEGFDLCATPRCQVYAGTEAEHEMSDRAIAATAGEILTWKGEPISALFTATCGGHTESASEIFPEEAAPYLTGVPCRAEASVLAAIRTTARGSPVDPVVSETGDDATRDWALLTVSGILGGAAAPARPDARVAREDLEAWTTALARRAGRGGAPAALSADAPSPLTLGEAAAAVVAAVGWDERARVLVSGEDVPALLRLDDSLPEDPWRRRALAYLAWNGAVRPFADGRFHAGAPLTRGRIVPVLARIGESYDAFHLVDAVVAGAVPGGLRVERGKQTAAIPLADRPFLFGWSGGRAAPAEALDLWPGDRIRYRLDDAGRVDFLELRPPVKGTSDDRSAAVYVWEVRKTRQELQDAVGSRLAIGSVLDLRVRRRGVSGRIVDLEVVGTEGSATVSGFDVRNLLGLKESLAVIEIQRGADGRIDGVVFAGKGWGHGVGLCQVGAYGMALRGAGYREILSHYYRGAVLESRGRPAAP